MTNEQPNLLSEFLKEQQNRDRSAGIDLIIWSNNMTLELDREVSLTCDLPAHSLKVGDIPNSVKRIKVLARGSSVDL